VHGIPDSYGPPSVFYHQIRRIKSMGPVVKVSAELDIHRKSVMATILSEQDDGSLQEVTCEFGTFLKEWDTMGKCCHGRGSVRS
jgi:hypothetical protein